MAPALRRRIASGTVLCLGVAALFGTTYRLVGAERERSQVVLAVSELRATATLYVQNVLLERDGRPADPDMVSTELTEVMAALLHGGELSLQQGSGHNLVTVEPMAEADLRRRMEHQVALTGEMITAGDAVRVTETTAPSYDAVLQELRTRESLLRSVIADTSGAMAERSAQALDRQLVAVGIAGALALVVGPFVSVMARRRAREEELGRFEALVQRSSDWVAVVDGSGVVTYSTPAGTAYAVRDGVVVGRQLVTLIAEDDRAELLSSLAACAEGKTPPGHEIEVRAESAAGVRRLAVRLTDLSTVAGVGGVVVNARDITDRWQLHAELAERAYHDDLTGLPNRAMLHDELVRAAARSERDGRPVALVYLDLDDFKSVNDAYGHPVGDTLLIEVAARLRHVTRPGDLVTRLGGDEFAVLVTDGAGPEAPHHVAQRILAALAEPVTLPSGDEVGVTASIGIRVWRAGEGSSTDILRDADVAMYAAKARGKGIAQIFDISMHTEVVERHEMAQGLRSAGVNGELALAYQPKVRALDGAIMGVEALLRWTRPATGPVSPGVFIPVAESSGSIIDIGRWVLEEGARTAAKLAAVPGLEHLTVAVNVAARQLASTSFVADAIAAVQAVGVRPDRLTLEVTETALQEDPDRAIASLGELRDAGFTISIDDFGTGYSSLHRLRSMPIDELKIDRSFVVDAASATSRTGAAMLRTIANLGRELGLTVVAEGVELDEELAIVRASEIDLVQGYLFQRPVPYDDLVAGWSVAPTPAPASRV